MHSLEVLDEHQKGLGNDEPDAIAEHLMVSRQELH